MSSKNSNNSDIEVIGPEDLEDSPPPQDSQEEAGESGDKEAEVTSGEGDQETIGEVKEAAPAPAAVEDDPPLEALAPAPAEDDPPVELLSAGLNILQKKRNMVFEQITVGISPQCIIKKLLQITICLASLCSKPHSIYHHSPC